MLSLGQLISSDKIVLLRPLAAAERIWYARGQPDSRTTSTDHKYRKQMSESVFNSVNQHCLDSVFKLAETKQVTAAEDIFDARGMKLWAKGAPVTPALQESLIRHKLRKPIETCLDVADGVNGQTVQQEVAALFDEVSALRPLAANKHQAIVDTLAKTRLHPVVSLLLTAARENGSGSFRHSVLVAMSAVSIALHQKLPEDDITAVAVGGLLHDIGEMYVNPDYLLSKRKLQPDEWKHVAVHPRIGQLLLEETTDYPKTVSRAVAEHHERLNGNGYPRQLSGTHISLAGQILSISEMACGILLHKDFAVARSSLALRIVPGEFSQELLSIMAELRKAENGSPATEAQGFSIAHAVLRIQNQSQVLDRSLMECEQLLQSKPLSARGKPPVERVRDRLRALKQALHSTVIVESLEETYLEALNQKDGEIFLELDMIAGEIAWRLRDMARELTLNSSELYPDERAFFTGLIGMLD